jgi:hypothetical protein
MLTCKPIVSNRYRKPESRPYRTDEQELIPADRIPLFIYL